MNISSFFCSLWHSDTTAKGVCFAFIKKCTFQSEPMFWFARWNIPCDQSMLITLIWRVPSAFNFHPAPEQLNTRQRWRDDDGDEVESAFGRDIEKIQNFQHWKMICSSICSLSSPEETRTSRTWLFGFKNKRWTEKYWSDWAFVTENKQKCHLKFKILPKNCDCNAL